MLSIYMSIFVKEYFSSFQAKPVCSVGCKNRFSNMHDAPENIQNEAKQHEKRKNSAISWSDIIMRLVLSHDSKSVAYRIHTHVHHYSKQITFIFLYLRKKSHQLNVNAWERRLWGKECLLIMYYGLEGREWVSESSSKFNSSCGMDINSRITVVIWNETWRKMHNFETVRKERR